MGMIVQTVNACDMCPEEVIRIGQGHSIPPSWASVITKDCRGDVLEDYTVCSTCLAKLNASFVNVAGKD